MKLYNNAFLVTITILSFSGALSITLEKCEKMPSFFKKETNEHQELEDEYQKLEEKKKSYGWIGVFTQYYRIKDIKKRQNDIKNSQLYIQSRLQRDLDAGSCGTCPAEIYAEMVALYAKIDDKK